MITKTVDGDNTIVTFTYEAETQKVTDTLTDAAKYLFTRGVRGGVELEEGETVDDLTANEMGTICDAYVKKVLKDAAEAYHVNTSVDAERESAILESDTKYI